MTKTKEEATVAQLANEIIDVIVYDLDSELEKVTNRLQSQLGRHNEKEYHDHKNTKDSLTNNLYERLINMKLSTIKRYVDNNQLIKRLISQVAKGTKDSEVNDGKVYTIDRELVTDSEGNAGVKQVRNYQSQASFDQEFKNDSDTKFTLKDTISSSDIKTPEVTTLEKADVIQVLKNLNLFTVPTRPFVSMLLTKGGEQTEINQDMKHGELNKKTKDVVKYIKNHKNLFNAIPSGKQYSLLDMAHFQNMLNVFEPSQVQKWLIENRNTPWVYYILNEVVDSGYHVLVHWDQEGYEYYTYQFINAMYELEEQYKNEVLK